MDDSGSLTTAVVALVVMGIFLLAALWMTIWFVVIPDWLLCALCRTRIASIRVWDFTKLGGYTTERFIKNISLSNRKICSACREQLDDDFPILGLWFMGSTVEYIKNTPALFAALVAIASLVVSVIALLWDRVL